MIEVGRQPLSVLIRVAVVGVPYGILVYFVAQQDDLCPVVFERPLIGRDFGYVGNFKVFASFTMITA